jgi:hypothetical protein
LFKSCCINVVVLRDHRRRRCACHHRTETTASIMCNNIYQAWSVEQDNQYLSSSNWLMVVHIYITRNCRFLSSSSCAKSKNGQNELLNPTKYKAQSLLKLQRTGYVAEASIVA